MKSLTELPEIYQLEAIEELDSFYSVFSERLLLAFSSIEKEAKLKEDDYLKGKSGNFFPEIDDEANILEDAYFARINYEIQQFSLKQDFLNISAVWLYHIFERRFELLFGSQSKSKNFIDKAKENLNHNTFYDKSNSQLIETKILNKINELRLLANAIKHGKTSHAFKQLEKSLPGFIEKNEIVVNEQDIKDYIIALKDFWLNAIRISKSHPWHSSGMSSTPDGTSNTLAPSLEIE